MNIILVKHSVPEIISSVPGKEWRLSRTGQIRCTALAEKLEAFSFWKKLDLPSFVVLSLPSHKIVKLVEGVV